MVTREELYRLVWSKPLTKASEQLGISYSKLVQICAELGVPRPPQGHWARLELGKADPAPPLPPPAEGQLVAWTEEDLALPKAPSRPRAPRKKAISAHRAPPTMHSLVRGRKADFLNTRPTKEDGFLRPFKRALPDIQASSDMLDRALLLANALYTAFEDAGHRVTLSGLNSAARRLRIDPREAPAKGDRYDPYPQPWRPDRLTLVQAGAVTIGLIVLEMTERVKMRHVKDGYVRDSPELAARVERSRAYSWTTFKDVPSGRFRIVAYAADAAVDWSQSWQESEKQPDSLTAASIAKAVLSQRGRLMEMTREAARQAEIRHREWLEEQEKWCRQEDERKVAKSREESLATLHTAIQRWGRVMEMEMFFSEAKQQALGLPADAKHIVLERLRLARELIGSQNPLDYLQNWKTPTEIYRPRYSESAHSERYQTP
ncbi:hypothetical protein [Sphingomonas elodea]|uniref:hypothetical protein n=1 Tax=Sphingomonas elodea TaxID=179878 RepID=UPI001110CCA6|nr:hypothetical protein [Sphingomonas elodea]